MMALSFYFLIPVLIREGLVTYYAYSISLGLPLLFLLISALVAYRLECNPMEWQSLIDRFRYRLISVKDWLWTGGIFAVEMLIYSQFSKVTKHLIDKGIISLPESIPPFVDPRTVFTTKTLDIAVGGLSGNWLVLLFAIVLLFINVLGEELWWRGLIFPRQEIAFGQ